MIIKGKSTSKEIINAAKFALKSRNNDVEKCSFVDIHIRHSSGVYYVATVRLSSRGYSYTVDIRKNIVTGDIEFW